MMTQLSNILVGVRVDRLTMGELHALIGGAIARNERRIVANHNFHSIYLFHNDSRMRALYACADYVHIDSMPLIVLGRLLGLPFQRKHRVTYVDWTIPLMAEAAEQEWRVFYLGSKPGVAEQGARILRERFPTLQIKTAHGYFDVRSDSHENEAVLKEINAFRPHVLMVGMGMPRQEHWILDNHERLSANAILNSGAAMDYVVGVVPTPPRWAGRIGLEWLFRLRQEPNRLWRRYLIESWFVLGWFLGDCFRGRRQSR